MAGVVGHRQLSRARRDGRIDSDIRELYRERELGTRTWVAADSVAIVYGQTVGIVGRW